MNKGPMGGSYDNASNHVAQSGVTHPTEATDMTGKTMAAMPVQTGSIGGSQRQATESEMRGGN